MIISDLNHLETISEAPSIMGGSWASWSNLLERLTFEFTSDKSNVGVILVDAQEIGKFILNVA